LHQVCNQAGQVYLKVWRQLNGEINDGR
jgi:hypothetical protein